MPTLAYEFATRNLSAVRRAFRNVEGDLDDVDDAEERVEDGMEDIESSAQNAAQQMQRRMADATDSVGDVGVEATESAQQLEREFGEAADEVTGRIDGMSEALTSFTQQDAGVDLSTSGAGGDGSGLTGLAIAANAATNLRQVNAQLQAQQGAVDEARRRVRAYGDALEEARKDYVDLLDVSRQGADVGRELGDAERRVSSFEQALEEAKVDAQALGADLDLDDIGDEVEDASGSLLSMSAITARLSSKLGVMGGVVTAGATVIATLGAAAATTVKQMADLTAEVSQYAQQLQVAEAQSGVAAEEIQSIFLAAQRLDNEVELDTVRDAFKELALRTEEAREGTGEAREGFRRLGISMATLQEQSPDEVLQTVLTRMQSLTAAQRTLTSEQILGGEAGERLVRMFGLQREELERLIDSTQRLALTQGQIAQLDELRSRYTAIQQELTAIKQRVALAFGPSSTVLLEEMVGLVEALSGALVGATRKLNLYLASFGALTGLLNDDQIKTLLGANANPEAGEGEGGVSGVDLGLKDTLESFRTDKKALEDDLQRGLIGKQEFLQELADLRKQVFEEVRKINLENADLDLSPLVDMLATRYQNALDRIPGLELPSIDTSEIQSAEVADVQPMAPIEDAIKDAELVGPTMEQLDKWEEAAKTRLKRAENNLGQIARDLATQLSNQLDGIVSIAADQLGRDVADGLFGLFGESNTSVVDVKLRKQQLRQQEAALRESLRRREITRQEFALRSQQIQQQLADANQDLARQTESVFKKAFRSIGDFVKNIIKQIIAQVVAAIARVLALKALASFGFGLGGGTVGQAFAPAGPGGLIPAADGAVVTGPTALLTGEYAGAKSNPEIVTPESKMREAMQDTLSRAGGSSQVPSTITLRADGRDLVAVLDTTQQELNRSGGV